jgi:hypothetical protein
VSFKNDQLIIAPISAAPVPNSISSQAIQQSAYLIKYVLTAIATSAKHQLVNVNVQVGLEVPGETEDTYQVGKQKFQSISHDPLNDFCAQTRPLNH